MADGAGGDSERWQTVVDDRAIDGKQQMVVNRASCGKWWWLAMTDDGRQGR